MTLIEPSVKKYNVRLSPDERDLLTALIGSGKHPARKLLKARILLKADISEAGEGWSDSLIAEALDTSTDTVYRTRQRLVDEGLVPRVTDSAVALRSVCGSGAGGRQSLMPRNISDSGY